MNKTQIRKAIEHDFLTYVKTNYPNLMIDDGEGNGRIYFMEAGSNNGDNVIEYYRSADCLCTLDGASDETKETCDILQHQLNLIVNKYRNGN